MTASTALETGSEILVGMGEARLEEGPVRLKAILGSCVGVAIYCARRRVGALAHVMLPSSAGRTGLPGKFADTAITYVVAQFAERGIHRASLVAKLAGGANMFATNGPLKIGDANVEAVLRALKEVGIPVVGKELAGTSGRRILLNCSTGEFRVETANHTPCTL